MGPRWCAQFTVDPAFVIVQLMAHNLVLGDKEERLPGLFIGSAFVSKAQRLVHTFQEDSLSSPRRMPVHPLVHFSFLSFSAFFYYRDVLRNFCMS